jgi:cytochrome c2
MRRRFMTFAVIPLLVCSCASESESLTVVGGDPEAGRLLIEQYGCGTCHVVPGVRTALGQLGPPLDQFSRHVYIAGEIPNQPEVLVRWIQDPQALVPGTAMPDLGVNEMHARDMSAYLYELR